LTPVRWLAAVLLAAVLAGCGTRGPLYLVGEDGRPRKTEGMPGLRAPTP
jgi:predicted small lipoprotein YifL